MTCPECGNDTFTATLSDNEVLTLVCVEEYYRDLHYGRCDTEIKIVSHTDGQLGELVIVS